MPCSDPTAIEVGTQRIREYSTGLMSSGIACASDEPVGMMLVAQSHGNFWILSVNGYLGR